VYHVEFVLALAGARMPKAKRRSHEEAVLKPDLCIVAEGAARLGVPAREGKSCLTYSHIGM